MAAAAIAANTTTAVDVASPAAAKGAGSGKTFEERRGGNVCGEGTHVCGEGTHLACVTDASIGKGIPFRTTGAKACGTQGTPVVAAGHTERAWGCNAGLPRSACLAGASRFEALLLNHRRRFPDAIVLVNAPHTLLSADNRRWAARACRRSAARPDLVSLECELDEQGDKTGCFTQQGGAQQCTCAVHESF